MKLKYWSILAVSLFIIVAVASVQATAYSQQLSSKPELAEAWQDWVGQGMPEGGCPAFFNTCIGITLSTDTSGSLNETCTYNGNGGSPQGALNCNLRRAIREASLRPTGDRPILIGFLLGTGDPNYDPTLQTWTLYVDDTLPALSRENTLDTNGDVWLVGTANPGNGRTDAPPVIVNNRGPGGIGSYSLEVESTGNTITDIAWKGGGSIILKDDGNTVTNVWVNLDDDGQSIFLRDPVSDPADMAGGGGISILGTSNFNVISGTVVAGTKFGRAINVDGDDNIITNNYVGTRADGTVPPVNPIIECLRSVNYDPANWYGGWGIQIGGSRNEVTHNILAGLHQTQSANETPPMALEVFGTDHLIQNNLIGVDSDDNQVGVCGIGLNISDGKAEILDNLFVNTRKGFEEDESNTVMYLAVDQFDPGGITMRGNIIRNAVDGINDESPFRVINFTGTTQSSLRLFDPAQVTSINGTTVTGESAPGSPCPNCYIDLYLDDLDETEEALEYLGQATANANGEFTFMMAQPIPANRGLRTTSTSQFSGTIGNFAAGTTSRLSDLQVAATSISINGPTEGETNTLYTFDIEVEPAQAMSPFTYTVTMTDLPMIVQGGLGTAVTLQNISWSTPGAKVINITAENALSSVNNTFTIHITESGSILYLPFITR
ncbi:MAG: hypothetical protein H6658_19465 [Ardenticatenaceae bacterium]|nr:hypothetical protein [Ardenticatenaceae bacterium]